MPPQIEAAISTPGRNGVQYSFAAAPDIIRSNQKDAFFQAALLDEVATVIRKVYGARFVHRYASEMRTFSDLLYYGCTILLGNRTLGEEYCDIVQVETPNFQLPSLLRRASFILSSVILPYILNKGLPSFRAGLRRKLESLNQPSSDTLRRTKYIPWIQHYLTEQVPAFTSPASFYAVNLAVFYFSGAYYHLGKRILGLRYLFTKRIESSDQRIGYEILGVLLVLQLSVQAWIHVQSSYNQDLLSITNAESVSGGTAVVQGGVEMGLGYPRSNDILFDHSSSHTEKDSIEVHTMTPVLAEPRYGLSEPGVMKWMETSPQRKCTLCLEELKDPSAALCGHIFCWCCISDWIKEKPECPLCRQSVLIQHILPLRE